MAGYRIVRRLNDGTIGKELQLEYSRDSLSQKDVKANYYFSIGVQVLGSGWDFQRSKIKQAQDKEGDKARVVIITPIRLINAGNVSAGPAKNLICEYLQGVRRINECVPQQWAEGAVWL